MNTPLPKLPRESHGFYVMMSSDTLRARDQEIVRVVLEAAVKACNAPVLIDLPTSHEYAAIEKCKKAIRALKFHHVD